MFAHASVESSGAGRHGRIANSSRRVTAGVVAAASFGLALDQGAFSPGVVAGSALAIWWALLISVTLGDWPGRAVPRATLAGAIGLALLTAWTFFSFARASDGGRVFDAGVRDLFYLGVFVLVMISARRGGGAMLAGRAGDRTHRRVCSCAGQPHRPLVWNRGLPRKP